MGQDISDLKASDTTPRRLRGGLETAQEHEASEHQLLPIPFPSHCLKGDPLAGIKPRVTWRWLGRLEEEFSRLASIGEGE